MVVGGIVFDLEGGQPKAIPTIASFWLRCHRIERGRKGGREMDLGLGSAISHSSKGRERRERATKECLLGHSDCSTALHRFPSVCLMEEERMS